MKKICRYIVRLVLLVLPTCSNTSFKIALPDLNIGEAVQKWIAPFEKWSGHSIEAVMFEPDDLGNEIGSELRAGTTQFAAYVFPVVHTATFGPYLRDLTAHVHGDSTLRWHDVAAFFRDSGCVYDGKVVAIIFDGDFHMFHYRNDILDLFGEEAPATFEEMVHLAIKYNGTDMNDDGEPDYGFCHISGEGYYFAGILFMGYYRSGFQTQGTQEGVWFNSDDFSVVIDNDIFSETAALFKRAMREGSYFDFMKEQGWDTRHLFLSGRCLFFLDWLDIPISLYTRNITGRHMTKYDANTTLPWVARGPKGSRVATMRPPGHRRVWDRQLQQARDCDRWLCPYSDNTGANRPVFAADGGWSFMINGAISEEVFEAAYAFAAFVSAPDQNLPDVLDGATGCEPSRYSQLSWQLWTRRGMEKNYATHLFSSVLPRVFDDHNNVQDPPVPGNRDYHMAVGKAIDRFLTDEIDALSFRNEIVRDWEQLHVRFGGKEEQLRKYRMGLGLPPLRNSDPVSTEDNSSLMVLIVLGVFVGLTLVIVCVFGLHRSLQKKRRMEKQRRQRDEGMVVGAMESLRDLSHAMVVVPADIFFGVGRLTSYEAMRDSRRLIFLDTWSDVLHAKTWKTIIFLSHQWLDWGRPDPHNVHYRAMVNAVSRVVKKLSPKGTADTLVLGDVWLWVDYCCVAQRNREAQKAAVLSLQAYATLADAFIIVAPEATHGTTKECCNFASYKRRGWCRAEIFAKLSGTDIENTFIATSEDGEVDSLDAASLASSLGRDAIHVFDGDFSCCSIQHKGMQRCDKEDLMLAGLALYLASLQHATTNTPNLFKSRSKTASFGSVASFNSKFKITPSGLDSMIDNTDCLFPKNFVFERIDEEGKLHKETRELFGHRIDVLKDMWQSGTLQPKRNSRSPSARATFLRSFSGIESSALVIRKNDSLRERRHDSSTCNCAWCNSIRDWMDADTAADTIYELEAQLKAERERGEIDEEVEEEASCPRLIVPSSGPTVHRTFAIPALVDL